MMMDVDLKTGGRWECQGQSRSKMKSVYKIIFIHYFPIIRL